MGDLYLGLSLLAGLSFVKVLLVLGQPPFWLFVLSGVPLSLILWNLIQVWHGDYRDVRRLGDLCRNTIFINLSITMVLTIQLTIVSFGSLL